MLRILKCKDIDIKCEYNDKCKHYISKKCKHCKNNKSKLKSYYDEDETFFNFKSTVETLIILIIMLMLLTALFSV